MLDIIIFTSIAFFISVILVLTNHYLNKPDKRVDKVLTLLPGYNCGSCGFGGCADMAYNIVKEHANPKKCRPMKPEQFQELESYLKQINIIKKD